MAILAARGGGPGRSTRCISAAGRRRCLPPAAVHRLLGALATTFRLEPGAEVTLEANPEDVTPDAARAWSGRRRQPRLGRGPVVRGRGARPPSGGGTTPRAPRRRSRSSRPRASPISGDLILGLPEQTPESFRRSVGRSDRVGRDARLGLPARGREVEDDGGGPARFGPSAIPRTTPRRTCGSSMGEALAAAGLGHYEISNWAAPGREARHNLKYWTRTADARSRRLGPRALGGAAPRERLDARGVRGTARRRRAAARSGSADRCPPKPPARRSSWVCASRAASRKTAIRRQIAAARTRGWRRTTRPGSTSGILAERRKPRPVHGTRLSGVERGAERRSSVAGRGGGAGRPR